MPSPVIWRRALAVAAMAASSLAAAQSADTLSVKRATELRDAPAETAASLAPLPAQSSVTRLGKRQGAWIEVRTAQGQVGWIHMFDAGVPPQAQGSTTTGALRGLTSLLSGGNRPATATGTSTIGIRGLGAEEIANAQPNPEAVARAEGLRQTAAQARSFASMAQLQARPVEPLPAPAAQPGARESSTGTTPTSAPTGADR